MKFSHICIEFKLSDRNNKRVIGFSRIVCVLNVSNIGPQKFSVCNFLRVRSIPTSILGDSYHFAVTKLAFPLLVEASWFLIKP